MNYKKYKRQYFLPPENYTDWVNKDHIEEAPIWCSVDLRDGNQALIEPMNLDKKLEFFKALVDMGFKEIEVGFPAASETEYEFLRALIEKNMIPDDVTIQVLTQAREHIIKKTFEAVKGAPRAIIHLYNSTSVAQREQVFKKSKEEIKKIATDGAKLLKKLADETEGNFGFEYSPESFHGTEVEYALEVCNAVIEVFKPTKKNKVIINIPATVETAMPHVFANQIAYLSKNLAHRENVILSIHGHNDRGCGIADTELGVLAGADRVEGTLFGNGERTGNVDILTVAMNLVAYGIDPKLDLSEIPKLRELYERVTNLKVHERHPYAGDLVFSAFSGSHQDAIAKGMACREKDPNGLWTVPYLPIDPEDVGRTYDSDVIRINSQSGKGGVSYILNRNYSLSLPKAMSEEVSYTVKNISDRENKEISPSWIYSIFEENYLSFTPIFTVPETHFKQKEDSIVATATIKTASNSADIVSNGNGRLDAVSNALKQYFNVSYELSVYEEHALTAGSSSKAMAYVGIKQNGTMYWGAGTDDDIIKASINALSVAVNKLPQVFKNKPTVDKRMLDMINYIANNYSTVTLGDVANHFNLTTQYTSKIIKETTGKTFKEQLTNVRLKRAKSLLRNTNTTIEKIAKSVGYPTVEHFSRTFKKHFGVNPAKYRQQHI